MKKHLLLIFIGLIFIDTVSSQSLNWKKTFGNNNAIEFSNDLKTTIDNNIVITGLSGGIGFGQENGFIAKISSTGDSVWMKNYGTDQAGEYFKSIEISDDQKYYAFGYTESFGAGAADMYLIKTDANGNLLWQKTYGEQGNELGEKILKLSNNNFLICGYKYDLLTFQYDYYVIRIDSSGNEIWKKTYGSESDDNLVNAILLNDGNIVLLGYTFGYQADFMDVLAIKIDQSGNELWSNTYDGVTTAGNSGDFGMSMIELDNSDLYILATENYIFQTSFTGNVWLIHTDSLGLLKNDESYYFDYINTNATSIVKSQNANYLVCNVEKNGEERIFLSRISENLQMVDSLLIIDSNYTHSASAIVHNNKLLITGYQYTIESSYQAYISSIYLPLLSSVDNEELSNLMIYPNPSSNYLNVKENHFIRFEIYNELGQLVNQSKLNLDQKTIKIDELKDGMYTLKLFRGNNSVENHKFIKN